MISFNQKIFDKSIAHQHGVIDFSRQRAEAIAVKLNNDVEDLKKEVLLALSNLDSGGQQAFILNLDLKKIQTLERKIQKIRSKSYLTLQNELLNINKEFMVGESQIQKDILYDGLDASTPKSTSHGDYFLSMMILGKTYDGNFRDLALLDFQRISKTLKHGISQGQSDSDIVKSIFGTSQNQYTDSPLNTSKNQLEAFATTSIIAAQTAVIDNLNKINSEDLGVMYGQFVAILDSRTSPICQSLSGKVSKYELLPHPPLHFNCRSHIVPFFKKLKGVSTQVLGSKPEETDYKQWLLKQPESIQQEVLGVKRAELLKNGKLSIDKFYSNNNDLLTLEELARKYKNISSSINKQ